MYKVIDSVEELYQEIEIDKNWTGAECSLRNRYPLRFVLFESFNDFNAFVQECSNHCVFVQGMDKWMDEGNDDELMTYSQLADRFKEYIEHLPSNDFVIAPFSEITRFYDNEHYKEFNSLVKTIRLISSPEAAQLDHQRVYIPIIGMQSKMNQFKSDPNIHIWEYRSGKDTAKYKLILTNNNTYGIQSLDEIFTICRNMREWIALWKVGNKVKNQIICSSKTIFDNAHNAHPDNAFDYVICSNVFEFLTKGLELDFGSLQLRDGDILYWEQLASNIDISSFTFESFVHKRFNSYALNNEIDFIHIWFEYQDDFSRWLLKNYYLFKHGEESYLNRVLRLCNSQSTTELFSLLETLIYEEPLNEVSLEKRRIMLMEAMKFDVKITELSENKVHSKLNSIATDPERGYQIAMKYITPLTYTERQLMIEWLGRGVISREKIQSLYPELYSYTSVSNLNVDAENIWINSYIDEYRKSKISNRPTDLISQLILDKNSSSASFEMWYNNFKTVKTILHNREDIDVYYWIDGLGVDWIPFITEQIKKHKVDGVYLNEIHIGVAELPSTTEINKVKLDEISSPNKLKKAGDLDTYAHSNKSYPNYIIEEFGIIEKAISSVLAQYNGKKIAFISDHGISYMAQYGKGLNIAGIKSSHSGRYATLQNSHIGDDSSYIVLEDQKTMCSMNYNSLTSKTPAGLGAHGGCTPEEVLVPIIIVSNKKNASIYSATLIDNEISASKPIVKYRIKGLSTVDTPSVKYNGVDYSLIKTGNCTYESERLNLVETSTQIVLKINDYTQSDSLIIRTGVDEDDLFGGF